MQYHKDMRPEVLRSFLRNGTITLGGHGSLKIYGSLQCKSGKRMKNENRVFFCSEAEALEMGFRPCGYCMKEKYKTWKTGNQ